VSVKLTYDPRYNIAYLRLHEQSVEVQTVQVNDELNVDVAPDGTLCGIDFLNANAQLGTTDDGSLIVVNEALGAQITVPLPG
jgi:uncharacterized protein YuzE